MTQQIKTPENIIDLGIGQPDPSLLPGKLFRHMNLDPLQLAYGKEEGDDVFREGLASWLSEDCGTTISPEELFITNGSSNALDMTCTLFSKPGDTVLVEDPTYFLALKTFANHGLAASSVPLDNDGINLQALEESIRQHKPAFIYTIPAFHNPTGISLSSGKKEALCKLARQYNVPVVADEVYQSLYFHQAPPPPLACFAEGAPVISAGSFSKILAPGLRLGWLQTSPELVQRFSQSGLLLSGGGLAPVTSALVGPMVSSGQLGQHIEMLKTTYHSRLGALVEGLDRHCSGLFSYSVPEGGFFLWATLDGNRDADELLHRARQLGAGFLPGNKFSASGSQNHALRLCFAWYDEARIKEACQRLGRLQ